MNFVKLLDNEVKELLEQLNQSVFSQFSNKLKEFVRERDKRCWEIVKVQEKGRGALTRCFLATRGDGFNVLIKKFEPYDFNCLSDEKILEKLEDFLQLRERIKDTFDLGNQFFNEAELVFIYESDIREIEDRKLCCGFGYLLKYWAGNDIENIINSLRLDEYIKRFELVLGIAQNVRNYHEKGLFHGDIKPQNFYRVSFSENSQSVIQNVDFDTIKKFCEVKSIERTTYAYYSDTDIENIGKSGDCANKDKLLKSLDITALAKILIQVCSNNDEFNRWNDRYRDEGLREYQNSRAWKDFFYLGNKEIFVEKTDDAPAQNLFCTIQAHKSLAQLYIFNCLQELIDLCLDWDIAKRLCDISLFEHKLADIITMLKIRYGEIDVKAISETVLRYFVYQQIDKYFTVRKLPISVDYCNYKKTNQYIREQIYGRENPYIDKSLLPHIEGDVHKVESALITLTGGEESKSYFQDKVINSTKRFSGEYGHSPLEEFFWEEKVQKSLYLVGVGGQGKTTMLWDFIFESLVKSSIPFYIDCKLLDPQQHSNCIHKYISGEAGFDLIESLNSNEQLKAKIILIIDGANEASDVLLKANKTENESNTSYLAEACKRLMEGGYRLIIASRVENITYRDKKDSTNLETREKKIKQHRKELDEVCTYGEVLELTDDQVSWFAKKYEIDVHSNLYRLIRNNVLFSATKDMLQDSSDSVSNGVSAGQLLNYYFEKHLKNRAIKNSSMNGHEDLLKKQFNDLYNSISEQALEKVLMFNDGDNEYLHHLAFLRRVDVSSESEKSEYVFSHEIYQEYFQARCILHRLKGRESLKDSDIAKLGDNYSQHYYDVAEYFGDLLNCENISWESTLKFFLEQVDKADADEELPETIEEARDCNLESFFNVAGILKSQSLIEALECFPGDIGEMSYACPHSMNLFHLNIPDAITKLEGPFVDCSNLTDVKFPKNLKEIGWRVFEECISLEKVDLPDTVFTISPGAFGRCTGLKKVRFPKWLKVVSWYAFSGCTSLMEIEFPIDLIKIERGAFHNCRSLKRIILPNGVKDIEDEAFSGCESLMYIEIPFHCTFNPYMFNTCRKLKFIAIRMEDGSIRKFPNI